MALGSGGSRLVRPDETTYMFIDGGYLRKIFCEELEAYFGPMEGLLEYLDFVRFRENLQARRAFYYDCVARGDDGARDSLTEELSSSLRRQRGVHVRLGGLVSEGARQRQKEVDVRLAVEMLTHSFSGNMTRAVLISGDRDFTPLVDALVQLGTYVTLLCDARSVAQELRGAADEVEFTRLSFWYGLMSESFRSANPMPYCSVGGMDPLASGGPKSPVTQCEWGARSVEIFVEGEGKYILRVCDFDQGYRYLTIRWQDVEQLKHFFEVEFRVSPTWQ
jgi:uncharacterized LabA/DUF88 family protein